MRNSVKSKLRYRKYKKKSLALAFKLSVLMKTHMWTPFNV